MRKATKTPEPAYKIGEAFWIQVGSGNALASARIIKITATKHTENGPWHYQYDFVGIKAGLTTDSKLKTNVAEEIVATYKRICQFI